MSCALGHVLLGSRSRPLEDKDGHIPAERHARPAQAPRRRRLGLCRCRPDGGLADHRRDRRDAARDVAGRGRGRDRPGPVRLSRLAQGAGAAPRRVRPSARRGAARRQGRSRPAGDARSRQGDLRGPRRGPGDDRHLRLRRRPVAPALRPDHRHGASEPSHDGDLAPDWRRGRDLGLQFPGRGLVLERGARLRLR